MPSRIAVAKELGEIFKLVAHPDRIRLIEELSQGESDVNTQGESDVNTLASTLDIAPPRVSQHLNQLRVHRIVSERRDGRRHIYSLLQPEIAHWILEALTFVEGRGTTIPQANINSVRRLWSNSNGSRLNGRSGSRSGSKR